MSILHEVAEKLISKATAKGADEVEFYGLERRLIELSISNNKVDKITERTIITYGVRAAINKRIGSCSSEDLSSGGIDRIVERVISLAKVSREDRFWSGFARGYSRGLEVRVFDEKLAEISHEELVELVDSAMKLSISSAEKHGASESTVVRGGISIAINEILIANSYNEEISGKTTAFNLYYSVKSIRNGRESTFNAILTRRNLNEKELMKEAERVGQLSVKFMNVKPIKSGKYQVLFMPRVIGSIIEVALAPAFSALNIQENRSPLKGKIEEEVLSPEISVIDDPQIPWGYGSRNFDDEGIATTRKKTVDKGILKSILYDYYTATREKRSSTGNGLRRTPASPPRPAYINLVLEAKNTSSIDELINNIKSGIIVYDTIGEWMSNPVNGGVQATITHGLYVENGKTIHAIKSAVLCGNIYKMLRENYIEASKEKESIRNIYTPAILIDQVEIAGE